MSRQRRLDALSALKTQLGSEPSEAQDAALSSFYASESCKLRERRSALHFDESHFNVLCKLGQGGYGEVYLCQRQTASRSLCAVKKMDKKALLLKKALDGVLAERDVLVSARSQWLTALLCAFQDADSLYLCMEYVPGGDLRGQRQKSAPLDEDAARFYMAEASMAVATLHGLGFIHRDIKPENFLIDAAGHLKLTDFGLSKGELSNDWMEASVARLERAAKNEPAPYTSSLDRRNIYRSKMGVMVRIGSTTGGKREGWKRDRKDDLTYE